jgi:asparagine synthase (glutamine-hydrolysing)
VIDKLNGIFSFVLMDNRTNPPTWLAARDPIGVIPMYYGFRGDGSVMFASEMKCLHDQCPSFQQFPPGSIMTNEDRVPRRWYNPAWWEGSILPTEPILFAKLRESLEAAVTRQLMSDVPYGVLLSGGLDSSLVASIASRHAARSIKNGVEEASPFPRLHTFSVGLPESPDLEKARLVADFLGTVHHEFQYTISEGLDALKDLVYMLETYDVTTIRASTPMYLMARKIRAYGFKMVLSGEGADEIFGGYLYFHKAPNAREFHEETVRKMKDLYMFDCLRANKSTMSWGLEARVPFLDREFIDCAMSIAPKEKMCVNGRMEKWILRKAFDTRDDPYLPDEVLWRQKEQFSDGVGYSWIDSLKEYAEMHVSDKDFAAREYKYPYNTPASKEAYFYRQTFEEHFPQQSAIQSVPGGPSIACSTAKAIEWDESFKKMADQSGRSVVGVHESAYTEGSIGHTVKSKL